METGIKNLIPSLTTSPNDSGKKYSNFSVYNFRQVICTVAKPLAHSQGKYIYCYNINYTTDVTLHNITHFQYSLLYVYHIKNISNESYSS